MDSFMAHLYFENYKWRWGGCLKKYIVAYISGYDTMNILPKDSLNLKRKIKEILLESLRCWSNWGLLSTSSSTTLCRLFIKKSCK